MGGAWSGWVIYGPNKGPLLMLQMFHPRQENFSYFPVSSIFSNTLQNASC